eukprot:TRINITY_DN8017_c0_g1_i1.p1 TRINITY_DN8017_c0_g1~~TRINITY_DN8017_c0_g1_i1.p1  ORF type:complete len:210 (-),score=15.62 TRINITY_DN8017_c0_g1_i1:208-837(-)
MMCLSTKSGKRQRGKRSKYAKISDDARLKLVELVLKQKVELKNAADQCGIKLSTARNILRVYEDEKRLGKKQSRDRKPRANFFTANQQVPVTANSNYLTIPNPAEIHLSMKQYPSLFSGLPLNPVQNSFPHQLFQENPILFPRVCYQSNILPSFSSLALSSSIYNNQNVISCDRSLSFPFPSNFHSKAPLHLSAHPIQEEDFKSRLYKA